MYTIFLFVYLNTEGVQEEYDDVMSEDGRNLLDYDDVEEEENKEEGHLA